MVTAIPVFCFASMSVAPPQLSFLCNNITLILQLPVFPRCKANEDDARQENQWAQTPGYYEAQWASLTLFLSYKEGTFSFVPPFEWGIKCVCVRVNVRLSATKSLIGTKQAGKSINSQRPLNCLHDTPTQSSVSLEPCPETLQQLCCWNCFFFFFFQSSLKSLKWRKPIHRPENGKSCHTFPQK